MGCVSSSEPKPYVGPRIPSKALCIGIDYVGTDDQLSGCVNDSNAMKNFLMMKGYPESEIVMLLEKSATRSAILAAIGDLVHDAQPGDRRFLHYSGHGTYIKGNNEETDMQDECICPIDYKTSGLIRDNDIRSILTGMPQGSRLTCVFDSCHSGTVCDLRYNYTKNFDNSIVFRTDSQYSDTTGDVIVFSGCDDNQTSIETTIETVPQGAMTYVFLDTARSATTYENFILDMRKSMETRRYDQIPQLSSGRFLDLTQKMLY